MSIQNGTSDEEDENSDYDYTYSDSDDESQCDGGLAPKEGEEILGSDNDEQEEANEYNKVF